MISFDEALALIEQSVKPLGCEHCAIEDAAGRVLAAPVHARCDAPRQAVAAMDGYAVVDARTRPGEALRVVGESFAGSGFSGTIGAGEAVRIFTGAPMPAGADRCIMQEYSHREGRSVTFSEGYGPGWHVREAGSDFRAGELLLPAGTRLDAKAMVAAAAADVAQLEAALEPRIAIICSGDELAVPGTAHGLRDAIPDSVSFGVAAMAQAAGATLVSRARGSDDLTSLELLAGAALARADAVIVTGGASVGERDFAKAMFEPHGLELLFPKVGIKPGKPVWMGNAQSRWVLGLPGNPTSAMVTARLFLLPLIARLKGQKADSTLRWRKLALAAPLRAAGSRETFIRARWDETGLVPLGDQDSAAQGALVKADCLIRCPAGQRELSVGTEVDTILF